MREHIAAHHDELEALVSAAKFRKLLGKMQGDTASRMPRGFDAAHPAAAVLKHKQFLAAREEAPAFAAQPDFYKHMLATFEAMAPFAAFLNEPVVEMRRHLDRDPLLGTPAPARGRGRGVDRDDD